MTTGMVICRHAFSFFISFYLVFPLFLYIFFAPPHSRLYSLAFRLPPLPLTHTTVQTPWPLRGPPSDALPLANPS